MNRVKLLLQKIRTVVQFAPPYSHRINAAEGAIHIFKNHFVEGLVSVEKKSDLFVVLDSEKT